MPYESVATVVSDTAAELGLGAVADVFASTDGNVVQLRTLLKRTGRNLAKLREWRQLRRTHSFTATLDETTYELPSDFGRMVNQSGWNRTQQQPMVPLSSQRWQYLKATLTGHTLTALFRLETARPGLGATLEFEQAPAAGDSVALEYLSTGWVQAADGETYKNAPTANTDVLLFDSAMLVPALKVAFLEAKGFDASAAQTDFDAAYRLATGEDVGVAAILSLGGIPSERLIDGQNAPETGYGA